MESKKYCVYCHTSPSGKRYVGITCQNPLNRWQNGLGYRYNVHFYRAILKYGWDNFCHDILLNGLSEKAAIGAEIACIAKFRSNEQEYGYNMTAGGEGCNGLPRSDETKARLRVACCGWSHSDEAKFKISEKSKRAWQSDEYRVRFNETRSGENHPMYGKKHRPESIEKMRQSHSGYQHTEEWIAWARLRFAGQGNPNYGAKYSNVQREQMSAITKARMENAETRAHLRDVLPHKRVCQFLLDGALLATHEGLHEAERATGVLASNISLCCREKRKTAGGFRWSYAREVNGE